MYNLAVRISEISKDIFPIIRFHPELDQKKLFNDQQILKNSYNNIEISKNSLEYDILESDFLIYRGSSMCVNAVFAGVFPIYFKQKQENSIDPLFEVNKYIAHSADHLLSLINKVKNPHNASKINKYMLSLRNYSSSYFENLNTNIIIKNL